MTELERLYGRYITMGKSLVHGRKYTIAKWFAGYRFVVMCDNVPILTVRDDNSIQIIRPEGEKAARQLQKVNMA